MMTVGAPGRQRRGELRCDGHVSFGSGESEIKGKKGRKAGKVEKEEENGREMSLKRCREKGDKEGARGEEGGESGRNM